MKWKESSVRAMGQRTINSTFSSNRSVDSSCNKNVETTKEGSQSHQSLSDFLNRKLHRSSVLPISLPGKDVAFSSPLSASGKIEGREAKATVSSLDFQMFKNVVGKSSEIQDDTNIRSTTIEMQESLRNKRKTPLVVHGGPARKKVVAVLGDDSKPTQTKRMKVFGSKEEEESKPLFNHYKSGRGWWDENMEGVDNEQVGCNQAWEGVGTTTLGGIEWH